MNIGTLHPAVLGDARVAQVITLHPAVPYACAEPNGSLKYYANGDLVPKFCAGCQALRRYRCLRAPPEARAARVFAWISETAVSVAQARIKARAFRQLFRQNPTAPIFQAKAQQITAWLAEAKVSLAQAQRQARDLHQLYPECVYCDRTAVPGCRVCAKHQSLQEHHAPTQRHKCATRGCQQMTTGKRCKPCAAQYRKARKRKNTGAI